MCGRYALNTSAQELIDHFQLVRCSDFPIRFNIAPSASVPVIRQSPDGDRVADLLRWGLVPHWAKDPTIGAKLNNARAESVMEKPSFQSAYQRRRCLIPASGFYEWQAVPGEPRKQPWFIHLRSGEPMAMGGLWESWKDPSGEIVRTFCVVTTEANQIMAPIHDRMPVLIGAKSWSRWLDPSIPGSALAGMLNPFPAELMEAWKVSRRVSNARDEGEELILPSAEV